MIIRACTASDVEQICDIYNYYIVNSAVTFEEMSIAMQEMSRRIALHSQHYPWLVCEVSGEIVGYAYASRWKERSAYKYTAEITVYVRAGITRQGYGKALYQALIPQLSARQCHAVLACITLPNVASTGLHERLGFEKVAHFRQVGFKFGEWRDVGYWQKVL